MTKESKLARLAGLFYLIVAVTGGFSELFVRENTIETGDAATTAANISASPTLFRVAFASDLVNITFFVLAALVLYALLKNVNHNVAVGMVVFNAVAAAIMSANMINHFAALQVATGSGVASPASDGLVQLFLDMHSNGYAIAQIFFGLWLLPLGYLAYKSGFFPKALGVMLMIGSASYLTELVAGFLFPGMGENALLLIAVPAALAEVSFLLWLLVKGARPNPGSTELVPAIA
jgi:hypothetical protein